MGSNDTCSSEWFRPHFIQVEDCIVEWFHSDLSLERIKSWTHDVEWVSVCNDKMLMSEIGFIFVGEIFLKSDVFKCSYRIL